MKQIIFILAFLLLLAHQGQGQPSFSLKAGAVDILLTSKGKISSFLNKNNGQDYVLKKDSAVLLQIRVKGKYLIPDSVLRKGEKLDLFYQDDIVLTLKLHEKSDYLTMEVVAVNNERQKEIELVVWGPYFSILDDTIGETVGVVRNKDFALGIQALNIKTIGGYPWNENDCMPSIDIFEQRDYDNLDSKGKRHVLYHVEAAKPLNGGGSSLQAYCRNRDKDRIIENMGYKKYVAPAWKDGGVVGSKIALFGCKPGEVLKVIEQIELLEGLPHTMMNGQWAKTYPNASAAYLIMDFDEKNIDDALKVVKKAGLNNLYHPGPFKTWGHFEIAKRRFPHGVQGIKTCVVKANRQGITLGLHTLSNFITRNDPYVTPEPDSRLAKVGTTTLAHKIGAKDSEIMIVSPEFFEDLKNSTLKTVIVGDELIKFRALSSDKPWRLLDCRRGAYHTKAAKHTKGDTIALLADHAYKVFLTNAELTQEVSKNLSELFNQTGLTQISFDGLEGNFSTGLGTYGEVMMPYVWYQNLDTTVKQNIIVHASRTTHFFWHIYTRMNWGEPWYADFRNSQTAYRMKNQAYFKRNYMPAMLGWYNMRDGMSMEDLEWMLARSAAYNAGYAFVTSFKTLQKHGLSDQLLAKIGEWERARMSGAFPDSLRQEMENIKNEYHLEQTGDSSWNFYRIKVYTINHTDKERQPGEPVFTTAEVPNPYDAQQPEVKIKALNDTHCENVSVEFDDYLKLTFLTKLSKGEFLVYSGGDKAVLFDKNYRPLGEVPVETEAVNLKEGFHTINVDGDFIGGEEPAIRVEIKYRSKPLLLHSSK